MSTENHVPQTKRITPERTQLFIISAQHNIHHINPAESFDLIISQRAQKQNVPEVWDFICFPALYSLTLPLLNVIAKHRCQRYVSVIAASFPPELNAIRSEFIIGIIFDVSWIPPETERPAL